MVALGAAVAGDASDTVLAGALSCGLVARFACSAHRVAVTGWGGVPGQVRRGRESCDIRNRGGGGALEFNLFILLPT